MRASSDTNKIKECARGSRGRCDKSAGLLWRSSASGFMADLGFRQL